MKHTKIVPALILCLFATALSSCLREQHDTTVGTPGAGIIISAASSYVNGDETRTEYSGDIYGSSPRIERIDWIPNTDEFTVDYTHGSVTESADFLVTSVSDAQHVSNAGVSPKASTLYWAEGSSHLFHAMYPTSSVNPAASLSGASFSASLPAVQDPDGTGSVTVDNKTWTRFLPEMDNAYMVAYAAPGNGISGNAITLRFRPAITTFEFRLRRHAGDTGGKVTKFELSSSTQALVGAYSFSITGGNDRGATWGTVTVPQMVSSGSGRNNAVTVNFPSGGATLPDASLDQYLDFTVFTLPVNQDHLTVRLWFDDGTSKGIPLADAKDAQGNVTAWHSFDGAKKYVFTNSSIPGQDETIYVLDQIDDIVTYGHQGVSGLGFGVTSYKYSQRHPQNISPVAWKTQYSTDGGSTWTDLTASGARLDANSTFLLSGLTGSGVSSASSSESNSAAIQGASAATETVYDATASAIRAKLIAATPRGTSANPFDLSMHPTYGAVDTPNPNGRTTANCYVVSATGYYMFPCVYGNAITKGQDNRAAYWPASSTAAVSDPGDGNGPVTTLAGINTAYNTDAYARHYYIPRFFNGNNTAISSPYIFNDITISSPNAIVLWQDTHAGEEIIPYTAGNIGITTVGGIQYIWFKIDSENIRPGNIVIALRDGNVVKWSWHIWVTEKDLTPTDVITNGLGSYYFMPYNLGYADSDDGGVIKYGNRSMLFRVLQHDSDGDHLSEPFTVTQIGDAIETLASVGGNPYYQWGRKDPFLPATPTGDSRQVSPHPDYTSVIVSNGTLIPAARIGRSQRDYATGIRQPWLPLLNQEGNIGTTGWVGGEIYPINQGYTLTKVYRGPFTFAEAIACNNAGFATGNSWDPQNNNTEFYLQASFQYVTGPYTQAQKDILTGSVGRIFSDSDFSDIAYPTALRQEGGAPQNLWNSYIYDEATNGRSDLNKFKTVYDPCPPGFAVPPKQAFIAGLGKRVYWDPSQAANGDLRWVHETFKEAKVTFPGLSPVNTSDGLYAGTVFFPYTGSRIFFQYSGSPYLQNRAQGVGGYYWTDCPFETDFTYPPGMTIPAGVNYQHDPTQIGYLSFYHSAYAMSVGTTEYTTTYNSQSYTRGSALSVRPSVDPDFLPATTATGSQNEGVSYNSLF